MDLRERHGRGGRRRQAEGVRSVSTGANAASAWTVVGQAFASTSDYVTGARSVKGPTRARIQATGITLCPASPAESARLPFLSRTSTSPSSANSPFEHLRQGRTTDSKEAASRAEKSEGDCAVTADEGLWRTWGEHATSGTQANRKCCSGICPAGGPPAKTSLKSHLVHATCAAGMRQALPPIACARTKLQLGEWCYM